jgi:hypothetical protein
MLVMSSSPSPYRYPPEHRPPRNPDPLFGSCLRKCPRSPGLRRLPQSLNFRVHLPDFTPTTARSFRRGCPEAATHNIPRTPTGIYVSFMCCILLTPLVSQIITVPIPYDDYVMLLYRSSVYVYWHDNTLILSWSVRPCSNTARERESLD